MSPTMVGRQRKIKKKHWLKRPKATPKNPKKINQNISDSKFHISSSFFENSISSIQRFYICPEVPVDIIRDFFLISEYLAEYLGTNKN